jgi:predicted O-methyltransferase YrrM
MSSSETEAAAPAPASNVFLARATVVQALLDLFERPRYLEVGVETGQTFHTVQAARKVAVDPVFKFDMAAAEADPANPTSAYHQVESDVYFADLLAEDERFDVVFLDGLHTFDQTLKDLLAAMTCLADDGVILIDDVMPDTYAASLPDRERTLRYHALMPNTGTWMGDVYRLVFFIDQYLPQFSFATMGENHGQLMMWRQRRASTGRPADKVETLARLEFADAIIGRDTFRVMRLTDILTLMPPRGRQAALQGGAA